MPIPSQPIPAQLKLAQLSPAQPFLALPCPAYSSPVQPSPAPQTLLTLTGAVISTTYPDGRRHLDLGRVLVGAADVLEEAPESVSHGGVVRHVRHVGRRPHTWRRRRGHTHWSHIGHTLFLHWSHIGHTLFLHWSHIGHTLFLHWPHIGHTPGGGGGVTHVLLVGHALLVTCWSHKWLVVTHLVARW